MQIQVITKFIWKLVEEKLLSRDEVYTIHTVFINIHFLVN